MKKLIDNNIGISAYNQINNYNNNVKKASGNLDVDDFLQLIVKEMQNQDPMSPMDNTQMVAQMAQFSSLQAMTDMAKSFVQMQATSVIGKEVMVRNIDSFGATKYERGLVDKVTINNGVVKVHVNNQEYDYSSILEITNG